MSLSSFSDVSLLILYFIKTKHAVDSKVEKLNNILKAIMAALVALLHATL